MTVDQRQGHVPDHCLQVWPPVVRFVPEILVHYGPLLGHVHQSIDPRVEYSGHGVSDPLRERHGRRVAGREIGDVRRVVGVAVPLGYPGVGGERQQLHHRSAVLVSQGDETLVEEVLENHQVEGRPIVQDEILDHVLIQRVPRDERAQPQYIHVQRYCVLHAVLVQKVMTYATRIRLNRMA